MSRRYIPPTGYESMKQCLPALRKVVPDLLGKLRPELKAKGMDYLSRAIPVPEFVLKRYVEMEKTRDGRTILKRFMVRKQLSLDLGAPLAYF